MLKNNLFSIFTLFILCGIFNTSSAQEYLISYDSLTTIEATNIEPLLPLLIKRAFPDDPFPISMDSIVNVINPQYDIEMYKVFYNCEHPVHGLIQATGAVAIPKGITCPMPLGVYQHGTTFSKTGVPSYLSDEHLFGALFSVSGYVTILPDYLGLGDSEYMHPYSHAQSTANAGRDLIRAVRELQDSLNFELNDEIVITGYSQGGHGAMALFKSLEEDHSDEFTVAACSPLSGAYSISGAQEVVMWEPYDFQSYLPYVIEGYRSVYPELAEEFDSIYIDKFSALNNFSGDTKQFFEILDPFRKNDELPEIPIEMIKDSFKEEYLNNENHPLKVAMRDNDNYNWKPKAPLLIQGCCDDEQVSIENSKLSYETKVNNGAENVTLVDYCDEYPEIPFLGHGECIPFCLVAGKIFFDEHTTSCEVVPVEESTIQKTIGLSLYPNPVASGYTTLQSTEFINKDVDITLYNAKGQLILSQSVNQFSGSVEIDLSAYSNGFYSFMMRSKNKAYSAPFFVQQ